MKQLLALFLLVSFFAQSFGQAFVVADYYINKGAFEKNCVNKNRPQLKCNGKCQMMMKMKEEEKKQQQAPERKSALKSIVISSKSFFASIDSQSCPSAIFTFARNSDRAVDVAIDIFHPPPRRLLS